MKNNLCIRQLRFLVVVALLFALPLIVVSTGFAKDEVKTQTQEQVQWQQQVEESFNLRQGMAHKLMTQKEWRKHQQKMSKMTAQKRLEYRKQIHERMTERAKKMGIDMPQKSSPQRKFDGSGGGRGGGRGR